MTRLSSIAALAALAAAVYAQPSPKVQQNILTAIAAAGNGTGALDYTKFVNPFVGTDDYGDVCPGASIPFGMVKFTVDMTGYAPAGYVADPTQEIRGISPLHDSGTGSSSGSYGNFAVMPLICDGGFYACTTTTNNRWRLRKNLTDSKLASPGYFSTTLNNSIQIEATSTRRAGLMRFTFPKNTKPYLALDLTRDNPSSNVGALMDIDPAKGQIRMSGAFGSSFGPGAFQYNAFACYDLTNGGTQTLDEYGIWTGDIYEVDNKGLGMTNINFTRSLIGTQYEAGALISYLGTPKEITLRVGVSFVSVDQACANAEEEVGDSTFEDIEASSKALWNEKLSRIEIDVKNSPSNITEMLYTSLYRSFLTPNNATGETQGVFAGTTYPYFDSLYCSWDTFRTFYPLMSLHSPVEFSEIVNNYLDSYLKRGWMPECRANNLPGWTQGGSSADVIVGHFAMLYHNEAAALGVDLNLIYSAMLADAENEPPEWDIQGRQADVYNQYGYVPFNALDPTHVGRSTREGSRTLEYAFEDFAIRQVALLLNKTDDVVKYTNRSYSYRNVWDHAMVSDKYEGFFQKRTPNGTFVPIDPTTCSPVDNVTAYCSLQQPNLSGFYESSSWEYSFFVPHDTDHLISLIGGNSTFVQRLNHFFNAEYFNVGNEPSFQTPVMYHYANKPAQSVSRVRQVVYDNFASTPAGLPGNDDQAAMATLLVFHLLGLYPVPSSSQYLVLSPFVPKYTIHNTYLGVSTTVTVDGYDSTSVGAPNGEIPKGASAYVKSVTVNGVKTKTRCFIDFYDTFRVGGNITITLTDDMSSANSCAGPVPDSLSKGGFAVAR